MDAQIRLAFVSMAGAGLSVAIGALVAFALLNAQMDCTSWDPEQSAGRCLTVGEVRTALRGMLP